MVEGSSFVLTVFSFNVVGVLSFAGINGVEKGRLFGRMKVDSYFYFALLLLFFLRKKNSCLRGQALVKF